MEQATKMLDPILSVAGAAIGPVAREAGEQIGDFLSFLDHLRTGGSESTAGKQTESAGPDDESDPLHQQLTAFFQRASQRLTEAGIDLSIPVDLGLAAEGQVQVVTAHPDALAIESVLNQDAELRGQFQQLAREHLAAVFAGPGEVGDEPAWQHFEVRLARDGIHVRS